MSEDNTATTLRVIAEALERLADLQGGPEPSPERLPALAREEVANNPSPPPPSPPEERRPPPAPPQTRTSRVGENFKHGARPITVRVPPELYLAIQDDVHRREIDEGRSISLAEPFLEWAREYYGVDE